MVVVLIYSRYFIAYRVQIYIKLSTYTIFLIKKTLNDIYIMLIVLWNSVFCGIFAEK